jgi:hypothetical protein
MIDVTVPIRNCRDAGHSLDCGCLVMLKFSCDARLEKMRGRSNTGTPCISVSFSDVIPGIPTSQDSVHYITRGNYRKSGSCPLAAPCNCPLTFWKPRSSRGHEVWSSLPDCLNHTWADVVITLGPRSIVATDALILLPLSFHVHSSLCSLSTETRWTNGFC